MGKDILGLLSSEEKWFLGDGAKLCFTPEFPEYRDSLGFFDKGSYVNFTIDHIFAITLLEDNRPVEMKLEKRVWYPHKVKGIYRGAKLNIIENKTIINGCFSSELYIKNEESKYRNIKIAAWCPNVNSKELNKRASDFKFENNTLINLIDTGTEHGMPGRNIHIGLSSSERINSYSVNLSQGRAVRYDWSITPFYEKLLKSGFKNEVKLNGIDSEGIVYSVVEFNIALLPGETKEFKIIKAVGENIEEVLKAIEENKAKCLHLESKMLWEKYFEGLPQFYCSDEYINKYYWYRWYGIRLNTISQKKGNYEYPFIAEGIGFFRSFITYSATCMALEARWMNNKALAEGIFYNAINSQLENGMIPGIVRENHYVPDIMYHTFWGTAALEVYYKFRDKEFLRKLYKPLANYSLFFENVRDCENSNLFDIINQIETGQEYSPRYLFSDKNADLDISIKLKGVDSTTYIYDLYNALEKIAKELDCEQDIEKWKEHKEAVKQSLLKKLWDKDSNMFYDVCADNSKGYTEYKKSSVKTLTNFYPFLTDIVDSTHIKAIYEHLLNEKEFWSEYPVPTISMEDPYFSGEAEWKGKRHVCPWNGRVWPITNCHVIEILAKQKEKYPDLEEKLVELINKTVKMMYSYGDIEKPNCYEHYNPFSGRESYYRGVNDYMHSWIVDIILKYVSGIRIGEEEFTVDPLNFKLEAWSLDNLYFNNHKLAVSFHKKNNNFSIYIDDKIVHTSERIEKVNLSKHLMG